MNRYKSRMRLRSFPCINKRYIAPLYKYIMHVNVSDIGTETMYRFNNGRIRVGMLIAFRMFSGTVYLWPRKLCAGADTRARTS